MILLMKVKPDISSNVILIFLSIQLRLMRIWMEMGFRVLSRHMIIHDESLYFNSLVITLINNIILMIDMTWICDCVRGERVFSCQFWQAGDGQNPLMISTSPNSPWICLTSWLVRTLGNLLESFNSKSFIKRIILVNWFLPQNKILVCKWN